MPLYGDEFNRSPFNYDSKQNFRTTTEHLKNRYGFSHKIFDTFLKALLRKRDRFESSVTF